MNSLINRKNKFINKLIEDTALREAVKREKTAEGKISYILEEISALLKQKNVKEFNGNNFTLKIV